MCGSKSHRCVALHGIYYPYMLSTLHDWSSTVWSFYGKARWRIEVRCSTVESLMGVGRDTSTVYRSTYAFAATSLPLPMPWNPHNQCDEQWSVYNTTLDH